MNLNRFKIAASLLTALLLIASVPANASTSQTLGNLSGKWTIPTTIKLPKGNCGTFNATFKLGPKSLKPGTNSTPFGYSTFALVTPTIEPIASETVSWDEYLLSNGSTSRSFKVKFCKTDWQNDDGDFLAGAAAGKVEAAIIDDDRVIKSSVKFVK